MTNTAEPRVVYWLDDVLYMNITNRCSNDCWFCFRNYKQGVGGFNLKLKKDPSLAEILSELQLSLPLRRWSEIVFCGFGEPTSRLDILLEVVRWLRQHYSSVSIRLDTNGHGCALNKKRNVAEELKEAGITKVSVSLNGHNDETYRENCRPRIENAFQAVIDFVKKAKEAGLVVEVSAVQMPEVDVAAVKALTETLGIPFRIREYIPCFW